MGAAASPPSRPDWPGVWHSWPIGGLKYEGASSSVSIVLEREWAVYQKKTQLDLYGKAVASEARANDCVHSKVR